MLATTVAPHQREILRVTKEQHRAEVSGSQTKIEGLKSKYALDSKDALGFFQVHESVDAWHSESEKTILADEVRRNPELGEDVKASVSEACDALNALLDGVCEARGIACVTK